jgi:hypothetical protein
MRVPFSSHESYHALNWSVNKRSIRNTLGLFVLVSPNSVIGIQQMSLLGDTMKNSRRCGSSQFVSLLGSPGRVEVLAGIMRKLRLLIARNERIINVRILANVFGLENIPLAIR